MAEAAAPAAPRARRLWLAPEVVQASPMDCGPSALHSLATGFGVRVSYARLREACQTDVDGTSIDSLERVARELGLDALQTIAPADHVGHPRSRTLPAIAVVRLPSGSTHFVLVWRRAGRWLQVMDPGSGRRWVDSAEFRRSLYVHSMDLPADAWRRFAGSAANAAVLSAELEGLGHRRARERVAEALADPHWRPIAALEASARMARSLSDSGALRRGSEAARLVDALFERARREEAGPGLGVPGVYWSARPSRAAPSPLSVRGALLVRARGLRAPPALGSGEREPASAAIAAALAEPPPSIAREVWREISGVDRRGALGLALLAVSSAGLVLTQGLVFRALFELGERLRLPHERLAAALALLAFVLALALLEVPLAAGVMRLGRRLEARLRVAFQERLPRLPQRWLGSRPSSDMAERAHGLFLLRQLPGLGARAVRSLATLAFTCAGLVWLDPGSAALVGLAALVAIGLPLVFQRALAERELLVRSHHGALSRFYLEALLGLVAVRVHGAERALRGEHEALLVEWARAAQKLARGALGLRVATSLAGVATAVTLLGEHLARNGTTPAALLFGYWALSLPALGEQIALVVLQAPSLRNAARRALEPLATPPESEPAAARAVPARSPAADESLPAAVALKAAGAAATAEPVEPAEERAHRASSARDVRGVALELRGVELRLAGHEILSGIDLELAAGEHVALVGRSGAGKSSLIALLLGLHRPSAGELLADGRPLAGDRLVELRRACAWIDPAVQLWNRSAFENLIYGRAAADEAALARVLEEARLSEVAAALPQGLATPLGEGGSFLSGGEGQRVRLARALLREDVRLALLDEPFRGLDRAARAALLARTRSRFARATLVAATHDIEETLAFDRVVVLEAGRVVEHGAPSELRGRPGSTYARLLAAERELAQRGWAPGTWTRWRVEGGRLEIRRPDETRGGPA